MLGSGRRSSGEVLVYGDVQRRRERRAASRPVRPRSETAAGSRGGGHPGWRHRARSCGQSWSHADSKRAAGHLAPAQAPRWLWRRARHDAEGTPIRGGKPGRGVAVSGGNSYSGDGGALILQGGSLTGTGGGDRRRGRERHPEESKEGMIRLPQVHPTSGLAAADPRLCAQMFFGDLTVHGGMSRQHGVPGHVRRARAEPRQDLVIQEETVQSPGLDSEEFCYPTSTLTRRSGRSDQWIEIDRLSTSPSVARTTASMVPAPLMRQGW